MNDVPVTVLMVLQRTTRKFAVYQEHVEKLEDVASAAIYYCPKKVYDLKGKPGLMYLTVSRNEDDQHEAQ